MVSKLCWQIARVLITLLLGMNGCLEQSVKTTVSDDGSCERTIAVTADSGQVPRTMLPLPADAAWAIRWEKREGKGGFLWTASKHFPGLEALAAEKAMLEQPGKIRIDVEAGRSFRWFYTYVRYRETYRRFTPLNRVPPGEVMTGEEIRRFTSGEGGDSLGTKVQEWKTRNYIDFFLHTLDTLMTAKSSPPVPAEQVRSAWRAVTHTLTSGKGIEEVLAGFVPGAGKKDLFRDSSRTLSPTGSEAMRRIFVKAMGTPSARLLPLEQAWDRAVRYAEQTSEEEPGGEFENVLMLPGLFLETNAGSLKGNTAVWSFKRDQIELADYVMEAESRVVNTWAFIVSGAVAVGFLALLFFPLFLTKRRI